MSSANLHPEQSVASIAQRGNLSFVLHSQPTPIAHTSLAPRLNEQLPVVNASSFQVKFLTVSIKVCACCRNVYQHGPDGKGLPSLPHNLCLVRKEQHQCGNRKTTATVLLSKRVNNYQCMFIADFSGESCMYPDLTWYLVRSMDRLSTSPVVG